MSNELVNTNQGLKPIIDYEGLYMISKYGHIFSIRRKKYLTHKINLDGYHFVHLGDGKERKIFYIHRIVAIHFLPNPENLEQVNHKDGNKSNNKADNLEWCTRLQNMRHAKQFGLRPCFKGESNPAAKLSKNDVENIRYAISLGSTLSAQARKYNVTITLISKINKGELWKLN